MKIIIETIVGLLIVAGVICIASWFLFREQFQRAIKYFRLWAEQDAKRETKEKRAREQAQSAKAEAEMKEARARELAEAEVDNLEKDSSL